MILDTSCVIAILTAEPEMQHFVELISLASVCRMSAATYVELFMVTHMRFPRKLPYCEHFLQDASIIIEPVTIDQAHLARRAFLDFGKGRHPAALNYGDCFAYALSKATGEPLLFKGNDFAKTDIVSAQ